MKTFALLLLTFGLVTIASADNFLTLKTEEAALQLCQKSAQTFNQTLDLKTTVDVLKPYFTLPEKMDVSDNFDAKQQINSSKAIWGASLDTIYIDTKKYAKDNFIQHRFLLKRANNPLYYQCTFYKPVNEWQLVSYSFNDTPSLFFNE